MNNVRIALAQINTIVGDLVGNRDKVLFYISEATKDKADLVVFPELAVTGYPPEDLLLKSHFIKQNLKSLDSIAGATKDVIAIVGFVDTRRNAIYNSAAILANKKVLHVYHKKLLPNYSVFDEKRYFKPGLKDVIVEARDFSFGLNICEDIWASKDIAAARVLQRAQFLINISASPYYLGKAQERHGMLAGRVKGLNIPIAYCNLIGGQDELVFDGRSAIFTRPGRLLAEAKAFEEDLLVVDLPIGPRKKIRKNVNAEVVRIDYKTKEKTKTLSGPKAKAMDKIKEVYSALVLGVRDYVRKNNFKKVALGLSGGIDSALVACIAIDAIGKANTLALSMPSRYSSKSTQDDAERLSKNLGIRFAKVPIDTIFDAYINTLNVHFTGMDPDTTEENIQARVRGNILMAFSNKFGYLVLNTGNKSEASVGYCTLYGDMAGGFAVTKDVSKVLVYKLARYVNDKARKEVIPRGIFERAPSAELRPDQKDQDTLPPYDLLDKIIDLYIEKDRSFSDIVKTLGNNNTVKKVLRMIDSNEYKRRQSPPGIKITPRSFGKDRRMPITNRFTPFENL